MKILSLWEPWASAMAAGWKKFETRSWATSYRGPLAIHAAKTRECLTDGTPELLARFIYDKTGTKITWPDPWPLGKVLAVVDLVDCVKTDGLKIDLMEELLGNYTVGRFAWKTANLRRVKPVDLMGMQGLRDLPAEVERSLEFLPIDQGSLDKASSGVTAFTTG